MFGRRKSKDARNGLSLDGNGMILIILASMAMMVMFIEIMLVPALGIIAQEFEDSSNWISWVLAVYLLVGAVATPIIGRLGDIYGKKRILIISMSIYIMALIGCSISWNLSSLIAFRAVQGIGMGMFPLAFGIVRDTFPTRQIPMAMGIISAMFSVGVSIGLLGGGYIVSALSWRDSFYIVAPLFAILAFASYRLIEDAHQERGGSIDLLGAFFLGLAIFSFLLALTEGESWGWYSGMTLGLLGVSLLSMLDFIVWERQSKDPIVRLSLLRNRTLLGTNIAALFVGLSMFLMFQTLPFFLRVPEQFGGLGLSDAFTVGLYMFPSAASQLIFAPLAGRLGRRIGHTNVLIIGLAVEALSFGILILLHGSALEIGISMVVAGLGMGFSMVALINIVALAAPKREFGIASGMNTLFRVIGGSIGPVLGAAIIAGYTVLWNPPGSPPYVLVEMASESGYVMAWLAGCIFSVVGLIIAYTFHRMNGRPVEAEEPEALVADV